MIGGIGLMTKMKQAIAEFFQQNSTTILTKGQLRKELPSDDFQEDDFHQSLKELEKEGLIRIPKKGKIQANKSHLWIVGKLNVNPKGFGFVVNKEDNKAVFIPKNAIYEAEHQDMVIAKIKVNGDHRSNPEGHIVSIVTHELQSFVGTFQSLGHYGFVVADDPRILHDVYIPIEDSLLAQSNDKVVVEITEFAKRNRKPVGRIKEVLGIKGEKDAELLSILKERDISYEFPLNVEQQAKDMQVLIPESERMHRLDLTQSTTFTIDGEDAKDLDDAISIEKTENGHYHLGVHIADVAHYVREGSAIDKEALQRGTSVYLIDTVVPMLPKELSNVLCSLQPNEDRLTLSVLMEINQHGAVVKSSFHESIIHSKARLNYGEVTQYVDGKNEDFGNLYPFLRNEMAWLKELTQILEKKRQDRGSIDFDFDEAKIILDEEGKVTEVKPYDRGISNQMIEECMLVCNETVAEFFARKELPFVYRVHSNPREERMAIFDAFLETLGYKLSSLEEIDQKELQTLLEETKEVSGGKTIQLLLLRSMMQARYASECNGHFGLATPYYTHFTSPIRRYPDLQIHRILKEYLHKELSKTRKEALEDIVEEASRIASRRERNAEQAEKQYKQLKKVEWMQEKIGEEFEGIITDVTHTALTVSLPNTVEGKVLLHFNNHDFFEFVEEQFAWIGETDGSKIQLGDVVRVVAREANLKQREVLFDLVFEGTV